jgi:ketosteroid isomerase-like protein
LNFLAANLRRSAHLVVAAAAIACSSRTSNPSSTQHAALQAGVDSAANRLLAALRRDDPDSLMALMAEDVIIMPPNEPVLKGKAAVRTWYEQLVKQMRTSSLTVTNREILIGSDWATEVAGFEWTLVPVAGGPPVVDRGSYIQVWRREPDGRWLFSREVWNSTAPPPPPKS